ncbi:MAG: hypothetical protein J6D08_01640 [Lachnospiraceae bacterium]|nr:hypothetical protein [Lachnospiraceae bacterium]
MSTRKTKKLYLKQKACPRFCYDEKKLETVKMKKPSPLYQEFFLATHLSGLFPHLSSYEFSP